MEIPNYNVIITKKRPNVETPWFYEVANNQINYNDTHNGQIDIKTSISEDNLTRTIVLTGKRLNLLVYISEMNNPESLQYHKTQHDIDNNITVTTTDLIKVTE
jgi:hypothetical protein